MIDLRSQTDEKALIGKLHHLLTTYQQKDAESTQKVQILETKLAR